MAHEWISVRGARVHNLSARAFPNSGAQGRRLVRLGAQLCAQDGSLINLDFARADLPAPLAGGDSAEIALQLKELGIGGAPGARP